MGFRTQGLVFGGFRALPDVIRERVIRISMRLQVFLGVYGTWRIMGLSM